MALALATSHIALMVIAATLLIGAAVSDVCSYRIPNYICALLLALFPCFVATAPHAIDWKQNIMVFGLMAVAGFVMFLLHLVGAGDIKLLTATGLLAGPHFVGVLVVVTVITGGLLSVIVAARAYRRHKRAGDDSMEWTKEPIPYGVAIATGGLAMLAMMAQPILLPS